MPNLFWCSFNKAVLQPEEFYTCVLDILLPYSWIHYWRFWFYCLSLCSAIFHFFSSCKRREWTTLLEIDFHHHKEPINVLRKWFAINLTGTTKLGVHCEKAYQSHVSPSWVALDFNRKMSLFDSPPLDDRWTSISIAHEWNTLFNQVDETTIPNPSIPRGSSSSSSIHTIWFLRFGCVVVVVVFGSPGWSPRADNNIWLLEWCLIQYHSCYLLFYIISDIRQSGKSCPGSSAWSPPSLPPKASYSSRQTGPRTGPEQKTAPSCDSDNDNTLSHIICRDKCFVATIRHPEGESFPSCSSGAICSTW